MKQCRNLQTHITQQIEKNPLKIFENYDILKIPIAFHFYRQRNAFSKIDIFFSDFKFFFKNQLKIINFIAVQKM